MQIPSVRFQVQKRRPPLRNLQRRWSDQLQWWSDPALKRSLRYQNKNGWKCITKKTMKGTLKNNHSHGKQIFEFGGRGWTRECLYEIMDRAIKRLEDDAMTEGEAKAWCIEQLPACDVDWQRWIAMSTLIWKNCLRTQMCACTVCELIEAVGFAAVWECNFQQFENLKFSFENLKFWQPRLLFDL